MVWHGVVLCVKINGLKFYKILMRKKLLLALQAFDLTNSLVCRLTKNRYSEMKFEIISRRCVHRRCRHRLTVVLNWHEEM